MDRCSVPGCNGPIFVRVSALCSRHYNRLRTTGTVADGSRARASFKERLWRQVDRRSPGECWPWTAKSLIAGYGTISRGGRGGAKVLAHRAAWELTNGPIPDGEGHHGTVVLHTCDNRLCCNPAHLRLGTQADNVRDMDAKGRRVAVLRFGGEHHMTKISEADVRAIRASDASQDKVWAERFGMHPGSVKNIRIGRSWKHVK
jgi:hypothetical protein